MSLTAWTSGPEAARRDISDAGPGEADETRSVMRRLVFCANPSSQELGESDSKSRDAAIHKLTVRMRRMEGGVSGRLPAPDMSADMMKRCQVGQDSPKAEGHTNGGSGAC